MSVTAIFHNNISVYLKSNGTYELEHSCRICAKVLVRMPNLCQSSVALRYDVDSGNVWYLEDGVVVDVGLGRGHDAFMIDMEDIS